MTGKTKVLSSLCRKLFFHHNHKSLYVQQCIGLYGPGGETPNGLESEVPSIKLLPSWDSTVGFTYYTRFRGENNFNAVADSVDIVPQSINLPGIDVNISQSFLQPAH